MAQLQHRKEQNFLKFKSQSALQDKKIDWKLEAHKQKHLGCSKLSIVTTL